ncbi:MAG: cadherin domain-containing protein, partial [Pirellulaceae bacterium]|nr:cadherin domain-containing protein [Pirellulaceae bacterium]
NPDGAYVNWTVHDSVAVFPWVESVFPQKSYARITFREDNVGAVMAGTTSVITDQLAYVARINRSTGFAPTDWVAGNTVEIDNGVGNPPSWSFQLQHGVFGTPRPYAYGGRVLDHVGSENWTGSITGSVFRDDNADGVQQPGELPVPGAKVRATVVGDVNGGVDVERINPDTFALNTDVSNISSNVTLVSAGSDNVPQGFKIRVVQRAFTTGDHIFSHEGVGFFNNDRRMRMDFYAPAQGVSIDFVGNSDFTATYGRLEIFNSADVSMGFIRTQPLGNGQRQRLSLSSPNNDIAWALAYPDNTYLNSSPFGILENLEITIPERSAITDADGRFALPTVPRGAYTLLIDVPPTYDLVFPRGNGNQTATLVGTEHVGGINFGLQGNRPPQLADQIFNVSEAIPGDSVLAQLPVSLGYPSQVLTYSITSGDPTNLFSIDDLGRVKLLRTELDFETKPNILLNVRLEDKANPALHDTAILELIVEDTNESPVVASQSKSIPENSAVGTVVATMTALDPDAGPAGQFTWSIAGGNIGDAFAVDPTTGVVSVRNASPIDFEQNSLFALVLRATDKGTPVQSGQTTLSVSITNINEAPIILGQALSIAENSSAGASLGLAAVNDPDANQTLQWEITGGSGSSLFDIDPTTGALTVAKAAQLDFEATKHYELVLKVSDSGSPPLSDTRTYTITVTDENDAPKIAATNFQFAENSPSGTLVGTFDGSDQDAGQTVSYSLSGPDASRFTLDAATGQLRTDSRATFDFESQNKFVLTVAVTDSATPPLVSESSVTITLVDINEAPVVQSTNYSVPENSLVGTKIGALDIIDQDAGDVLQFELLTQTLPWVTLNPATGEMSVAAGANINFEGDNQNRVTVRATDKAGVSTTATITISATDRNDPPRVNAPLAKATAKADQLFSYTVPASTFTDPDTGDQLNLFVTLSSGFPLPGWLTFNRTTGVLSGTPAISDGGTLNVNVTAIDKGGASAIAALEIVVDANQIPWHNANLALDVSSDGEVTARDALLIINFLNTTGPSSVASGSQPTEGFLDTSGDNSVSARDVLLVINQLNLQVASEGEAMPVDDVPAARVFEHNSAVDYEFALSDIQGQRRRR